MPPTSPMISVLPKKNFILELGNAITQKEGFSAGKIGFSEQAILGYSFFCNTNSSLQRKAYETFLKYHCDYMTGVFPSTPEFLEKFTPFYLEKVQQLSFLGLMGGIRENELIAQLNIPAKLVHFQSMEPDRTIPEVVEDCYLPALKDKKVLLISPYAQFLQSRGQALIYEQAWKAVGKKWFDPARILALEIPYSYVSAINTHAQYGDSIKLFNSICNQIDQIEFDIALIGAGALGIPLAVYIQSQGKVGISLGGHLQIIFGVSGARWNRDPAWSPYLNDAWDNVPDSYQPASKDTLADQGAYW